MLLYRIITIVIWAPIILYITWIGHISLAILFAMISLVMFWEFQRMLLPAANKFFIKMGYICVLFLNLIIAEGSLDSAFIIFPVIFIVLCSFTLIRISVIEKSIHELSIIILGIIYTGALLPFLYRLRILNTNVAQFLSILTLCIIWGADIGAYISGRLLGKHLLYPKVSPKKTIEGVIGAVLMSIIIGFLLKEFLPLKLNISNIHILIFSISISVFGIIGDLFESMLKRVNNIKDSSNILPGHGGLLDRFDSMLFVAPITWMYYQIFF